MQIFNYIWNYGKELSTPKNEFRYEKYENFMVVFKKMKGIVGGNNSVITSISDCFKYDGFNASAFSSRIIDVPLNDKTGQFFACIKNDHEYTIRIKPTALYMHLLNIFQKNICLKLKSNLVLDIFPSIETGVFAAKYLNL